MYSNSQFTNNSVGASEASGSSDVNVRMMEAQASTARESHEIVLRTPKEAMLQSKKSTGSDVMLPLLESPWKRDILSMVTSSTYF